MGSQGGSQRESREGAAEALPELPAKKLYMQRPMVIAPTFYRQEPLDQSAKLPRNPTQGTKG